MHHLKGICQQLHQTMFITTKLNKIFNKNNLNFPKGQREIEGGMELEGVLINCFD